MAVLDVRRHLQHGRDVRLFALSVLEARDEFAQHGVPVAEQVLVRVEVIDDAPDPEGREKTVRQIGGFHLGILFLRERDRQECLSSTLVCGAADARGVSVAEVDADRARGVGQRRRRLDLGLAGAHERDDERRRRECAVDHERDPPHHALHRGRERIARDHHQRGVVAAARASDLRIVARVERCPTARDGNGFGRPRHVAEVGEGVPLEPFAGQRGQVDSDVARPRDGVGDRVRLRPERHRVVRGDVRAGLDHEHAALVGLDELHVALRRRDVRRHDARHRIAELFQHRVDRRGRLGRRRRRTDGRDRANERSVPIDLGREQRRMRVLRRRPDAAELFQPLRARVVGECRGDEEKCDRNGDQSAGHR